MNTRASCSSGRAAVPPIRILYVTTHGYAGGANYVELLARGTAELGCSVTVVGPPQSLLESHIQSLPNVEFLGFQTGTRKYFARETAAFCRLWHRRLLNRFDIVHSNGVKAGLITAVAGFAERRARLVYTPHCFVRHSFPGRIYGRVLHEMERWASRRHQLLLAVCDAERQEALAVKMNRNAASVYLPLAAGSASSCCEDTSGDQITARGFPIIGTIGRLEPQKGISDLIRSLSRVREVFPGVQLLIGGDGSLRHELEGLAAHLGLEKNVRFLGYLLEPQDVLQSMDVFVLSSRWEALPYALLEAGLASKPVVATDVGGVREIIGDSRGWLIRPGDIESLATAVIECLAKREDATKRAACLREWVLTNCSLDAATRGVLDEYLHLLGR